MLWGGIAATIPDLDVLVGNFFMNEINGLAFHRAITHSIFFAVTFSFILSFYTQWLYAKGHHKSIWYKLLSTIIGIVILILGVGAVAVISKIIGGIAALIVSLILLIPPILYLGYRLITKYLNMEQPIIDIGWKSWYKLFFWTIFTHPLLDCFTVYGTQLFAPFSNYRVAFNSISVVDPLYTVPFICCLIFASFIGRTYFISDRPSTILLSNTIPKQKYNLRKYANWAGIIISSCYLIFTLFNKMKVNKILENTLKEKNISYSRYMTGPTILNNILWSATAESDTSFYTGHYSFNDNKETFKLFEIPKNHFLIDPKSDDKVVNTLKWFSKDYYAIIRRNDGRIQINDLRYSTFKGQPADENGYVFRFVVQKDTSGRYHLDNALGGPPRGKEAGILKPLFNRIKGI